MSLFSTPHSTENIEPAFMFSVLVPFAEFSAAQFMLSSSLLKFERKFLSPHVRNKKDLNSFKFETATVRNCMLKLFSVHNSWVKESCAAKDTFLTGGDHITPTHFC